jgi:hypothetical protein
MRQGGKYPKLDYFKECKIKGTETAPVGKASAEKNIGGWTVGAALGKHRYVLQRCAAEISI